MPAKWSKYDDQRLPNPKDDPSSSDSASDDKGPSKRLHMNWTTPNKPKTVTADPVTGKGGPGASNNNDASNNNGDGSAPTDDDSTYENANPIVWKLEGGGAVQPGRPDYDELEVATDDLEAYEQNILTAASNLVSTFNALWDRTQMALDDPMWGKGEGHWVLPQKPPSRQTVDTTDTERHFVASDSAVAAQKFTESIRASQQGALQNAADMITLSGMFIEVLDTTVSSYAQMDQMTVFPDPQQLKKAPNQ